MASEYRSVQRTSKRVSLVFVFLGFALPACLAEQGQGPTAGRPVDRTDAPSTLTRNDGRSVVAAALDSHARFSRKDCSHLVHAIYARAGFPYSYASSSDLYRGTGDFRRISRPQPGDLIVWHGHVGIVVNPAQHLFFSTLRYGPGIDAYDAEYWKERGSARFFRYVKHEPVP